MSMNIVFMLFFGGVIGGIISSIAGGSSIVSYPLLLMSGMPPLNANVTNHGALIMNYLGAISASTKELQHHWRQVLPLICLLATGVVIGTYWLFKYPASTFERVVPILLIICGLLFLFDIQPQGHGKNLNRISKLFLMSGLFILIGCYTGYFGGANGVLILTVLESPSAKSFLINNAMKNTICFFGDMISFAIYIFRATVYWRQGFVLAAGMIIGGYLGPVLLRSINLKHSRWLVSALAFIQAAYFFIKAY